MMTTFFLPSLRRGLEDIVGYYHAPMQRREMDEKGFTGGDLITDYMLCIKKLYVVAPKTTCGMGLQADAESDIDVKTFLQRKEGSPMARVPQGRT